MRAPLKAGRNLHMPGNSVFEKFAPWVVLKFGGTSVSSASNWHNIAGVLRERIAAHMCPAVVHSAMSGVTDRLDSLLSAAVTGGHEAVLERIEEAIATWHGTWAWFRTRSSSASWAS